MTIEELQGAYGQLEDLVRTLADHVAALSTRVDRGTFQTTRIANASEATNTLAETEVRESKLANERAALAQEASADEIRALRISYDNLHTALWAIVIQVAEAKTEARRAADNSRTDILLHEANAPRRALDDDDTDKRVGRAVLGVLRHAWVKLTAIGIGSGAVGAFLHWLATLWRK